MGVLFGVLWFMFIVGMIIYSSYNAPEINKKKRQEEIRKHERERERKIEEFKRKRPILRREKIKEISREQRKRNLESGTNKKGIEGELRVRAELEKLGDSYVVFHNITVADAAPSFDSLTTTEISQIDHLIIGQGGIYVIETKNYSGIIRGSMIFSDWTVTYQNGQVIKMFSPINQNSKHIQTIEKMIDSYCNEKKLNTPIIPFYNIVALTGTATLKIEGNSDDSMVLSEALGNFKEYPVTIIKRNQLNRIVNMVSHSPKNLSDEMCQLIKDAITENLSLTMPDKSQMTKEEKLTHLGEGIEDFLQKEKTDNRTSIHVENLEATEDNGRDYNIYPSFLKSEVDNIINKYNFSKKEIHEVDIKEWEKILKNFMCNFTESKLSNNVPIKRDKIKACYDLHSFKMCDLLSLFYLENFTYLIIQKEVYNQNPNLWIFEGKIEVLEKVIEEYPIVPSQFFIFTNKYNFLIGEYTFVDILAFPPQNVKERYLISSDTSVLERMNLKEDKLISNTNDLSMVHVGPYYDHKSIEISDDELPF